MTAPWYTNPDCSVNTEAGHRAFNKTFYASASGRKCLCLIEAIVMALPEDNPAECKAKMTAIGLVNTIKRLAGVNDRLAVIEAEGRVANRPAEKDSKKKPKKKNMYQEI